MTPYRTALNTWVAHLIRETGMDPQPLHPAIQQLANLLQTDPALHMLATETCHSANSPIRNPTHLLQLMNAVLTRSPEFSPAAQAGILPLYAVIQTLLGTPAAAALFLHNGFNAHLRRVLDTWADFLRSPGSRYTLTADPDRGWFSPAARQALPDFEQTFLCDPTEPHLGFRSWDGFFTRQFRPGIRPVAAPDDPLVITNACESAPYRIATGVHATDTFSLKGFPYSLRHMLARDELADQFIGGTVYQAFLSSLSYHRWHSPVTGTVRKAYVQQGTYFWQLPSAELGDTAQDDLQGYTTPLATRAILFLEADDPRIGLLCVLPVGMFEVSSCEITVQPGQRVRKGDELGMFHFGGSTHCLLFRPGVELDFDLQGQTPGPHSSNLPVNTAIAKVRPNSAPCRHNRPLP